MGGRGWGWRHGKGSRKKGKKTHAHQRHSSDAVSLALAVCSAMSGELAGGREGGKEGERKSQRGG